mmetsp:Transcript_20405/g.64432  ORF Transcript_20405/g.64432 Transcript_20405/m.64432 type:complete len:245 (+) Transcript_20405:466-1200(+)
MGARRKRRGAPRARRSALPRGSARARRWPHWALLSSPRRRSSAASRPRTRKRRPPSRSLPHFALRTRRSRRALPPRRRRSSASRPSRPLQRTVHRKPSACDDKSWLRRSAPTRRSRRETRPRRVPRARRRCACSSTTPGPSSLTPAWPSPRARRTLRPCAKKRQGWPWSTACASRRRKGARQCAAGPRTPRARGRGTPPARLRAHSLPRSGECEPSVWEPGRSAPLLAMARWTLWKQLLLAPLP